MEAHRGRPSDASEHDPARRFATTRHALVCRCGGGVPGSKAVGAHEMIIFLALPDMRPRTLSTYLGDRGAIVPGRPIPGRHGGHPLYLTASQGSERVVLSVRKRWSGRSGQDLWACRCFHGRPMQIAVGLRPGSFPRRRPAARSPGHLPQDGPRSDELSATASSSRHAVSAAYDPPIRRSTVRPDRARRRGFPETTPRRSFTRLGLYVRLPEYAPPARYSPVPACRFPSRWLFTPGPRSSARRASSGSKVRPILRQSRLGHYRLERRVPTGPGPAAGVPARFKGFRQDDCRLDLCQPAAKAIAARTGVLGLSRRGSARRGAGTDGRGRIAFADTGADPPADALWQVAGVSAAQVASLPAVRRTDLDGEGIDESEVNSLPPMQSGRDVGGRLRSRPALTLADHPMELLRPGLGALTPMPDWPNGPAGPGHGGLLVHHPRRAAHGLQRISSMTAVMNESRGQQDRTYWPRPVRWPIAERDGSAGFSSGHRPPAERGHGVHLDRQASRSIQAGWSELRPSRWTTRWHMHQPRRRRGAPGRVARVAAFRSSRSTSQGAVSHRRIA